MLDRLELLPEMRGRGLGLAVMRELIKRFGAGAGLVAVMPLPAQFGYRIRRADDDAWFRSMRLGEFAVDQTTATRKLSKHYRKVQFVSLPGTPFMVRSMAWPV
ncbi:MAG: hypothetical protein GEV05_30460 [Betaproteobacteria bacterium]|nr:hypothetical protein [Betaproteobacteria bacterium]